MINLKSSLQELREEHIKLEGVFELPDPKQGDLGALLNTEFEHWDFLEQLVQEYYDDAQKTMWEDKEYMTKAFNLLRAYIANKLMKKPEVAQMLIDLLFLMYRDVKKAEADAIKREENPTPAPGNGTVSEGGATVAL